MKNENIKGYLYIALIVALVVVSFSVWSFASSFGKSIQPSSFRSFAVSGDGKAIGIPDVAVFSFSVITEGGKDVGALQAENSEKANAAIEFVKTNGVDSKDVKTQNYSVSPRYQYYSCSYPQSSVEPCPPPSIVGYTVSQSVQVKIRDFSKIGDILSGVVLAGANTVSQLQFTIDDPTKVQNEARAEAIQKAKEKALAIAEAGGFRLGRLLSIDEGGSYPRTMYYDSAAGMGVSTKEAVPAPTIEPGSEETNITVTLRYEIK
jgi:uncharacterized protein YggE